MSNAPMDRPTESLHPDADVRKPSAAAGESKAHPSRIGPYTILKVLGEGGMGTVYLAEQTVPIHRKVALKIIKLGMDTRSVIARFEAEREALAMMNHPNVARVFDAGATEQGRPYFAMEYVEGVPITQYCDHHRLTMPQRLELFMEVCRAIQHAHQKGIIHRDIKPSNILVTAEPPAGAKPADTAGSAPAPADSRTSSAAASKHPKPLEGVYVKVIDFGIAKATQQKLTDHTFATEQGMLVGTPAYMSPEQADPLSSDIDTRTDVYSLGVLLYELLVGTLPFDSESLRRAALTEIVRIVREVDPPKPSSRVGMDARRTGSSPRARSTDAPPADSDRLAESAPAFDVATIASRRSTDPRSLHRQVRGELDWIVMKCLEKDRTRRYETATALVEEIQRYLQQQPVLAGPPSAAYRVRKFIRRNKLPVAAATAVIVALAAGLVGTSLMYVRANRERARTEIAAAFLSDILKGAGPAVARGRDAAMLKEMVAAAAVRIHRGELKGNPDADLMLQMTLGQTYLDLGDYPNAQSLAESAASLACGGRGVLDDACADARLLLGGVQFSKGDFLAAMGLYNEVIETRTRALGEKDLRSARARNNLGSTLNLQGKLPEAKQNYIKALEVQSQILGDQSTQVAETKLNIGTVLFNLTEWAPAETALREAMETFRSSLGPDHPWTLDATASLGRLLGQTGRFEESIALLTDCVAVCRRTYPPLHPKLGRALQFLANVHTERQDSQSAIPLYREALDIMTRSIGSDVVATASLQSELGRTLLVVREYDEAELHLRSAYDLLLAQLGDDHPDVAHIRTILIRALTAKGEGHKADSLFRQSIEQVRSKMGTRHYNVFVMQINLGVVQLSNDNYAGAERTLADACSRMGDIFGLQHPGLAVCHNALGGAIGCQGDWPRSEPELRRALEIWTRTHGEQHPSTPDFRANMAFMLSAQGKFDEAEPLARSVIAALDALGDQTRRSRYDAMISIATAMSARGEFDEAEKMMLAAFEATSQETTAGQCSNREFIRRIVEHYEARVAAQPRQGHEANAAQWRTRLDRISQEIAARQAAVMEPGTDAAAPEAVDDGR